MTLIIFATGCGEDKNFKSPPPVAVVVGTVINQPVPLSIKAVGAVEPIESVAVKAQVGGVITQVNFSEGQEVETGRLLFQVDPRPFQNALAAAEAQLAKDKAQAANAETQAKRYADLVKKDFVTREQYETASTQADMLKSVLKVDEAEVAQAKLNLGYASITAPISGRTGSLLVKKGNVIRANEAVLVVINQMRPIRVNFAIPGTQLPLVRRYAAAGELEVLVKTSRENTDNNNNTAKGRLTFFDNMVEANTGTVTLKAEFDNNDGLLWPGQFVDTELILAIETNAVTVPTAAIVTGQEGTFVFVVAPDMTVQKKPVKVNRTLDGTVVVDEGLQVGETVVIDGQMELKPGSKISVKTGRGRENNDGSDGNKQPEGKRRAS